MDPVRILLVSGSLREGSTNSAFVRTAAAVAPVAALRAQLGAADAVLFSAPEYAGALPGSFKNLLEWTVGGTAYRERVAEILELLASHVRRRLVDPEWIGPASSLG